MGTRSGPSPADARAYLRQTFENTKAHAEAKVADHGAMLRLSEKYLAVIAQED